MPPDDSARAHGGLVEVLGLGVLLLGPSGIGKSECALELVQRGHRLVADDVVCLRRSEDGRLFGSAPELIRHFLEIRGLGVLFVPDLFGPDAVRDEAEIGLVCRLEPWRPGDEVERVGLERAETEWLGVRIATLVLPVRPASSMATLVETAVRDVRVRRRGPSGAERLEQRFGRLSARGRESAE